MAGGCGTWQSGKRCVVTFSNYKHDIRVVWIWAWSHRHDKAYDSLGTLTLLFDLIIYLVNGAPALFSVVSLICFPDDVPDFILCSPRLLLSQLLTVFGGLPEFTIRSLPWVVPES
jgi:hypothetical protein